jgi:outer membrane protein insertion porin family
MKVRWANGLRGIVAFGLLAGAAVSRAQTAPETQALAGDTTQPLVLAIRIVSEDGRVLSESPKNISVAIGKPLDRAQVAESLRALYRTGNYADLRAEAVKVAGGIQLEFVGRENLFFNQVVIEGLTPPPTEASAAAAMQLALGMPYRRQVVDEALERLREVLKEEGLYTAEVFAQTVPHIDKHEMDVIVHVKPGKRARVEAIHLTNGTEFREPEILAKLKMKPGSELTLERLQRGTDRIRKFLVKKGHLSARAAARRGDYDPGKNTVPLELDVTEGPKVLVAVTGAKVSKGDLKKLVPVFQEGAVDTDLLEEGKRNLRERLERQGYFDAKVDYTTETREVSPTGNGWRGTEETIRYKIERGARHKLVGIEITGNHYFSTELLKSRLQIFGGDFASAGRFSRRLVDSDAQSMRELYFSNGFLDAKVETEVKDDYKGKEGLLAIKFDVTEGKQTRVASLAIEGIHAFKEDELLGVIGSTPGQPYSDFGVTTDRDNILALYFNEGFPEANFTSTADRVTEESAKTAIGNPSEQNGERKKDKQKEIKTEVEQATPVRLVYRIQEGPQTRVRRVLLSGFVHTRPGVIRREVRLKTSEPLREGDVVDSQRRLYNLGVFNRVTIGPQNPNGTDPDKDIVVLVEEAKRYTLAYGGGFEVQRLASTTNPTGGQIEAAPRGILEISKLNLTGRADSLSLKLRGSTLQGRALLGYASPDTFGSPNYSFQASAYAEKTRDINTFTETQYVGTVQLTDQVTPITTFVYRYSFRKVLVSNLNSHVSPEEIPLFEQPTLVSQFGVTWLRDSRDNPAEATKGSYNSADFSDADTKIGSSASFLRFFFQNSTYYPIKRRFSFARSIRLGILVPYRDTVSLTFPAPTAAPFPTVIPLPERFFAGGGTSLRGFALNQAGPRDANTGFPVGGQALLVLNQEIRFPMRLPFFGTALGGAIFYDGGNVYSRLSRVSLRWEPPAPVFRAATGTEAPCPSTQPLCKTDYANELNYFAHTVGIGLRYATPVGPIRIDLGYQLNRPQFVIPCPNTTLDANGLPICKQATRLPGFQIFFNLGSSF